MTLERFANFTWWFLTHKGDPREVEKFRLKLWRPPLGEEPTKSSPWSAENELKAFNALRSQLGLPVDSAPPTAQLPPRTPKLGRE